MKIPFATTLARLRLRQRGEEPHAVIAGFLRVLEQLLPRQPNRLPDDRPAWPQRLLREKP